MAELIYDRPINRLRDGDLEVNPLSGLLEPAVLLEYYACNQSNGSSEGGVTSQLGPSFATITEAAAIGPDGAMSAFKLTEDTNNVYHDAHANQYNTADGVHTSMTIYAKAGTRTKCWIGANYNGVGLFGKFDLVAGTWIGGTPAEVTAIDSGNGWWRFDSSFVYAVGNEWAIGLLDDSLSISYAGDGTSYILLFRYNNFANYLNGSSGVKFVAANVGAPIPPGFTNTAPSQIAYGNARAQDYPWAMPYTALPQASSGLIEFIERGTIADTGRGIFQIGNYINAGARFYIVSTGTGYSVVHNNGSASVASTLVAKPKSGDIVRLRWSLNANGSVQIWQSINGAAETAGSVSAANALAGSWTIPWIFMGSLGITNVTGGYMAFRQQVVLAGADISQADLLSHFT